MISSLQGKVQFKKDNYLIVQVNGVGYKVFVSHSLFSQTEINAEISLFTHQQVGEQILALFGFLNFETLEFFQHLISVSGVGPKTALNILDASSIDNLQNAILAEDADLFLSASGIGRKTAEKIILELKTKIGKILKNQPIHLNNSLPKGSELDALLSLGYSLQQAREALAKIDPNIQDESEKIRKALQVIK